MTSAFGGQHSIQLSYGCVMGVICQGAVRCNCWSARNLGFRYLCPCGRCKQILRRDRNVQMKEA